MSSLNVFGIGISQHHKAGTTHSCNVARCVDSVHNKKSKTATGQEDAVIMTPSTIATPINTNHYYSMSLNGIIVISLLPAPINHIPGTTTDATTEENISTPISLTTPNSDYTVFINSGNTGIISVTVETIANYWLALKLLMLYSNLPHLFSNVYF